MQEKLTNRKAEVDQETDHIKENAVRQRSWFPARKVCHKLTFIQYT